MFSFSALELVSLMWLYYGLDALVGGGLGWCWNSFFSEVESKSDSLMSMLQDQPVPGASQPKVSFPSVSKALSRTKGYFAFISWAEH